MSHADPGPLSTYNSLQDKNLVGYFNNNRMRRHLRKSGLINKRGEIVTESTYRLTMARKEHQRHVRDLMAQAIVHKALDMERHRQASIKKKLEEIAKVELVRRVRSERARKGDEDITPFLSPRAPSGRPHSATSHRRRTRGNPHRRPSTAPTNKSASYDKQHAVYVDEDGFPVHRERSYQDDSEEIDSHNLRELDPKVMNNISLHLRPEDREGLAPYRVNQALKPHPPPSQAKSQRLRQRPAKSKTVITKDGRKLKPKSHKGSLALHRKEPAYPHANQLQTMCDVTVRYRGNNLKIQYEREDLRDEITIYQQHCGGENLLVFEGMAEPGTDLVFTSRRHRGYPFSVTFFVNRVQSLRLSACCEYKYTPHSLLGGAKGHFKFIRVDGAAPCYRCMVEAELARRERQRYRGTQTEQRDPSPEPEPEKIVIATQTEETGEEEENKGEDERSSVVSDHGGRTTTSFSDERHPSSSMVIVECDKVSTISSESLKSFALETEGSCISSSGDEFKRKNSSSVMSGEGQRSTELENERSSSTVGSKTESLPPTTVNSSKSSQRQDEGGDLEKESRGLNNSSEGTQKGKSSSNSRSSGIENVMLIEEMEALDISKGNEIAKGNDRQQISRNAENSSDSRGSKSSDSSDPSKSGENVVNDGSMEELRGKRKYGRSGDSSTSLHERELGGQLEHYNSDVAFGFRFEGNRSGSEGEAVRSRSGSRRGKKDDKMTSKSNSSRSGSSGLGKEKSSPSGGSRGDSGNTDRKSSRGSGKIENGKKHTTKKGVNRYQSSAEKHSKRPMSTYVTRQRSNKGSDVGAQEEDHSITPPTESGRKNNERRQTESSHDNNLNGKESSVSYESDFEVN